MAPDATGEHAPSAVQGGGGGGDDWSPALAALVRLRRWGGDDLVGEMAAIFLADAPRRLAAAVVGLPSVDAVNVDPDGALVILSRNVLDLQIELPRLAQRERIRLLRVEPLDDSLESVFGYLVES